MKKTLSFFILSMTSLTSQADDSSSPVQQSTDTKPAEVQELEEVTVTGDGLKQTTAQSAKPVTVLSGEQLRTKIGQTLGETLSNELGITNQSFGAGVGTPVIRGQAGPRVRVMQNSLGNNDVSSLSPDHATGVDPVIAERVEVLRGPSTLLYSNGAIGGVVNVIDNRIPEQVPQKIMRGAIEQRYDSATDENATALKLEGGKGAVAYHVDGFYRDQEETHIGGVAIDDAAARKYDPSFNNLAPGTLQNSDGIIKNTQARSRGGSVGVSYINDVGLIGAAANSLEKKYGIAVDGQGNKPVHIELTQSKYDLKAQLNKPFAWADAIRMKLGYTDYQHIEFEGNTAGTTFLNTAFESRLELEHHPINNIKGTAGFQSTNNTFEALGDEGKIIPKSDIASYALFDAESFTVGDVTYNVGGRVEWQTITPDMSFNKGRQVQVKDVEYFPLSGSASAEWQINDQHQISLGFTHSQRAPQIQELFSQGVHNATRSYDLGDPDLNKEISNNIDVGYRFNNSWMSADINLFHNWVGDYIYQQRTGQIKHDKSEMKTQQTGATFKGFEAQTMFTLMQNDYGAIDLTLFGDYTRGTLDNGFDVPRMPPLRYGFQLSYEYNDFAGNLRFTRAEAQHNPGYKETETAGYLLLNLQTQYRLASFYQSEVLLFAKGKNLLDENIRNSVSYLRNFAPEPGRSAELGIRINY